MAHILGFHSTSESSGLNLQNILLDVESSSTADHSVEIQSLESCLLKVTTDSGAITTKSVKGDLVELITNSGTVDCGKSIQGNINICTNSGVSTFLHPSN